jgi:hypothetical protein
MISSDKAGVQFPDSESFLLLLNGHPFLLVAGEPSPDCLTSLSIQLGWKSEQIWGLEIKTTRMMETFIFILAVLA